MTLLDNFPWIFVRNKILGDQYAYRFQIPSRRLLDASLFDFIEYGPFKCAIWKQADALFADDAAFCQGLNWQPVTGDQI